jgi:hypothetical protein
MVFIFSTSQLVASLFCILSLLIVRWGSSFIYVYMEASSLDVNFSLVFHYSTSQLEASNAGSSIVFDYCTLQQAPQPQCKLECTISWIWECSVVMDLTMGRVLVAWVEHIMCLGCGVLIELVAGINCKILYMMHHSLWNKIIQFMKLIS